MGPPSKRKRKAPTEGDEAEESEWEDGGNDKDDDDDDDASNASGKDDSGDDESPEKKKPARKKPKPRSKEEDEVPDGEGGDDYDEVDFLPSHARLTEKGGYAHTSKSRLRISRANRGNTPWNKGKNRSHDDKAKISAGVRARNRAILLEKLKRLGMTEEEWLVKKKEIKYIRERLRRAKRANAHRQAEVAEQRLKEALAATTEKDENAEVVSGEADNVESGAKNEDSEPNEKVEEEETAEKSEETAETSEETVEKSEEVKEAEDEVKEDEDADEELPPPSIFAKDFNWTTHAYDSKGISYTASCPQGGPGGLICCASCTAKYSDFLSTTTNDIEQQKAAKMGGEMTELLGFLSSAKKMISQSVRAARRKPPPIPRMNPISIANLVHPSSRTSADLEEQNYDVEGTSTELLGFLSSAKKMINESVEAAKRKATPIPRVDPKSISTLVDPSSLTSAILGEQNFDVVDSAEV